MRIIVENNLSDALPVGRTGRQCERLHSLLTLEMRLESKQPTVGTSANQRDLNAAPVKVRVALPFSVLPYVTRTARRFVEGS
jgi:hypothetical protein